MASRADGILSAFRENMYALIDMLNFGRNGLTASVAACQIAKIAATPALIGTQAASGLLLTGCGALYLTLAKGIPEARESREKAHQKYQEIIAKKRTSTSHSTQIVTDTNVPEEEEVKARNLSPEQKSSFGKLMYSFCEIIASLLFIEVIACYTGISLWLEFRKDKDILSSDKQAQIAQKKAYLATLTEIYWAHMIRIGSLQIAIGITSMLTYGSTFAHFVHQAGCIAASTGMVVAQVLGGALGITYILRGGALIYRSRQNRKLAHELRSQIEIIYKDESKQPNQKALAIKELLETYCATSDDNINFLKSLVDTKITEQQITAAQAKTSSLDNITTQDELSNYVTILNRGLHKEIVTFEVGESLGWAMLLGGTLTLIATFASSGTSLAITTLISSIVFLYLEGTFALYDSSDLFDKYQNDLYKQPGWLLARENVDSDIQDDAMDQQSMGLLNITTAQESVSPWWYISRTLTALPRIIHYLYEKKDASTEQLEKL
ncbi:MAG: hypothetical protein K2Y01_05215 [Rhabdochlamydiaceae bacterium]|nr:hypothetical protein [Rhabdochlamydiaceae bacterium]